MRRLRPIGGVGGVSACVVPAGSSRNQHVMGEVEVERLDLGPPQQNVWANSPPFLDCRVVLLCFRCSTEISLAIQMLDLIN